MQTIWQKLTKEKLWIGLAAGILLFLLSFPMERLSQQKKDSVSLSQTSAFQQDISSENYEFQLEKRLEALLSGIQGVGKVQVMVIFQDTGQRIPEKDVKKESSSDIGNGTEAGNGRSQAQWNQSETTVLEGGQTPWITRELLPQVAGIAVVAEGADQPAVKAEISHTLEALFGLPAHKIEVLKGEF